MKRNRTYTRLEVNSERRNERECHGGERSEGNPGPRLLQTEGYEGNRREGEDETVGKRRAREELENRVRHGKNDRVREHGVREEIPERTAEIEERFGILRSAALELHVGNRTVFDAAGEEFDVLFDHLALQYEPIALFTLERKHSAKEFVVDFSPFGFVCLKFADVLEIQEFVRGNFGISPRRRRFVRHFGQVIFMESLP